jgi:predicted nucleic acid-binding protein
VKRLVVDASIVAKWIFNEIDSVAAEGLLKSGFAFHAPDLLLTELANIVWKNNVKLGAPRGVWSAVTRRISNDIIISDMDLETHDRAFQLAADHRHPVYDCLYLAIAVNLGCNVITADRRFAAAFSTGVMAGRVQLLEDWAAAQA